MASIGDALIYGIPFLLLTLLIFGITNELYFLTTAGLVSDSFDYWNNYNGKCFVDENKTQSFCKSDFGFLGMKQWVDEKDYDLLKPPIVSVIDSKCDGDYYQYSQIDDKFQFICSIEKED